MANPDDKDPLVEARKRARAERKELEKRDGPSFLERHGVNVRHANPQHSKQEIRWGTPSDIVERARKVMGSIDLDPCSSISFNSVVKAKEFYSLDDFGQDGLQLPWKGNVFVNPPGGLVKQFWRKAFENDNTCNSWPPVTWNKLFWVGFSLEQLAILANEEYHPMDFSFCVLRKRIRFTRHDNYSGSPTHSNYVCAVNVDHNEFANQFNQLGRVYPRK